MHAKAELMRDSIEIDYRWAKTGSGKYTPSTATHLRAILAIEGIIWGVEDNNGA